MAIYMKHPVVKGNVTADGYKDHLSLLSLNFGVSRGISMEAGAMANREATRPSCSEVSISKESDSSCINLFKESVSGNAGQTVEIHVVRTGADKIEKFVTYELSNCMVSSYSVSCGSEGIPMENITLSYSKIMVTYANTDESGGGGSQQVCGYDVALGKKV